MSPDAVLPTIQQDVDLSDCNTLAVPASARHFATVTRKEELVSLIAWARQRGASWMVLGGGSNVVLAGDFPGLMMRMQLQGQVWTRQSGDDAILQLAAGENWHRAVMHAARAGYRGIENLALIPGTVGAAPVQNIGAYGVELADVLVDVEVLDTQDLSFCRLPCSECGFAYRDSLFKRAPGRFIITGVRLALSRNRDFVLGYQGLSEALAPVSAEHLTALQVANAVIGLRQSKLPDPDTLPNAGSFFKNPVVSVAHFQHLKKQWPDLVAFPDRGGMKLAAGWLIDRSGWKGFANERVGVHRQQALVLVNHGGGSGRDILELAERIQADIKARFEVTLEIEPRVVPTRQ